MNSIFQVIFIVMCSLPLYKVRGAHVNQDDAGKASFLIRTSRRSLGSPLRTVKVHTCMGCAHQCVKALPDCAGANYDNNTSVCTLLRNTTSLHDLTNDQNVKFVELVGLKVPLRPPSTPAASTSQDVEMTTTSQVDQTSKADQTTQQTSCPTGWTDYSGWCLAIVPDKQTHDAAQSKCQDLGGRLVTADTPEKETQLNSLLAARSPDCLTEWTVLTELDPDFCADTGFPGAYNSGGSSNAQVETCIADICSHANSETSFWFIDEKQWSVKCVIKESDSPEIIEKTDANDCLINIKTGYWIGMRSYEWLSTGALVSSGINLQPTYQSANGVTAECVVAHQFADFPWYAENCNHEHFPVCERL